MASCISRWIVLYSKMASGSIQREKVKKGARLRAGLTQKEI